MPRFTPGSCHTRYLNFRPVSAEPDDLRDFVRLRLAVGFEDWPTLVTSAVQYAEDEEIMAQDADGPDPESGGGQPENPDDRVRRIVAEEWPVRFEAEKSWPAVTDCDRLDAAFAELQRSGIVARQDFTCCRNCGETEIRAELADTDEGYVFFHAQDTERAVEGGALWLRYGAVTGPATPVGQRVADALTRHGLTVDWDGDPERAIRVPLTWQRRIGPLPIVQVRTERGQAYPDPSEDLILELLDDLTAGREEFFIIEKTRLSAEYYAQSTLNDHSRFIVECRDGGPDRHWQAVTPDRAVAHAVLTRWAFDLDNWRTGLNWTRLHFD